MFTRFRRNDDGGRRALQALVAQVNALEPEMAQRDDDVLRATTGELRSRLDRGEDLDDLMVEAFAVVREASRRVLGERHHDVQLMGGAALHFGWVAEMKTGEGKTLASTLPAYLNSLSGKGVHLVTANEYLAARDAEWMGRIHRWLGLGVGLLTPDQPDRSYRREQYAADITYGTSDDFGYDYLRDNRESNLRGQRQRGHNFALVDDADSILVDRARSELSLSDRTYDASALYRRFASLAHEMQRATDYEVDEEQRTVLPTDEGIERAQRVLGVANLYDGGEHNLVHHLQLALRAKELFTRDDDYLVTDGQVKRIDANTGRADNVRWSGGLHEALEAKEGVEIRKGGRKLATVTLHNYLCLYDKLAGMTGTAMSDAAVLRTIYDLDVVVIPTNKPVARVDRVDLIYRTGEARFNAVAAEVAKRHESGQPVLVGTASVERSELLSAQLDRRGIPHEVLNAKEHAREAEVIAQAGRLGAVTVATNMAGRGVDIVLGGTPETATERNKVSDLGGLCVLGTERHHSRRLDDQLRGRAGRQGEPGESQFHLSLDDDLVRPMVGALNGRIMSTFDNKPLDSKMVARRIERRQASLSEWRAEQSKQNIHYDEVEDEQRTVVYALRSQTRVGAESNDPDQISSGLRPKILETYLPGVVDSLVEDHCAGADREEWDLEALQAAVQHFWRSTVGTEQLSTAASQGALHDQLMKDALASYEQRERELGPKVMRVVERRVMLRAIDQRWSAHLDEMATLREGIHLWRLANTDPLHAWREEGSAMFDRMMHLITRDVVRMAMVAEVDVKKPAPA